MTSSMPEATTTTESPARPRATERLAASEMRTAMAKVSRMRPLLYVALAGAFLGTVFAALFVGDYVSVTRLVISGTGTALVLVALMILDRWPVAATLPLALLHTAVGVYALTTGVAWDWMDGRGRSIFWAVYCWIIVIAAVRASRLMKAHPDLYQSKWMRGEGGDDSTGHVARALAANRAYKMKERRVLLWLSGFLVLVLLLGFFGWAFRAA